MYKIYYCQKCEEELIIFDRVPEKICSKCNSEVIKKYNSNILTKEVYIEQNLGDYIKDMKIDLEESKKSFMKDLGE
jgi:hypothetical protein